MIEPLKPGELVKIGIDGGDIPIDRALATYGDPDNWETTHDEMGCHWIWKGPVICAYELAQLAFKYSKKE